jgi:benzil reductase ((S)-benzoin forming)
MKRKVFIITGANRGLGEAFVDVLIKNPHYFIISISRSKSEEQKTYSPQNFYFLEADLSHNNFIEKITVLKNIISDEAICFINNASIIEPIVKIEDLDEPTIDNTISVNIKSTMLITKFLLKNFNMNLLKFVNISSGAANRAISNWSLYCSSKAFIQMFFNVAESEYKQHRFFNIDPGVMDTGMQKSLRDSDFPDVENFKDLQKEGQLKSPIDVAEDILKTIKSNV